MMTNLTYYGRVSENTGICLWMQLKNGVKKLSVKPKEQRSFFRINAATVEDGTLATAYTPASSKITPEWGNR